MIDSAGVMTSYESEPKTTSNYEIQNLLGDDKSAPWVIIESPQDGFVKNTKVLNDCTFRKFR